jgi:serine/threonine protein kinase
MMSPIIEDRPNCEEILNQKNLWALSEDDFLFENMFEVEAALENILKPKKEDEDFLSFRSVILSKLYVSPLQTGYYNERYKEEEELGEGNYGKVFKVIDKINKNENYAIEKIKLKKIQELSLGKFEKFPIVPIFKLLNLSNEHILKHHELWIEKNENYLDIILYDKMEQLSQIGYYIASQLFIELLEGVNYLHGKNIIHKYLNPSNILLKTEWNNKSFIKIKISGFGLMKFDGFAELSNISNREHQIYIAPEVECGTEYNTKADIYSLGLIMKKLFYIDFNRYN